MKRAIILACCATASSSAAAQVTSTYLNVFCGWQPTVQAYQMEVLRFPGQTVVHTIIDPAITGPACTSDANDLINFLVGDLQGNGTMVPGPQPGGGWGMSNDQLDTAVDIFCPDVGGVVENPVSIGSLSGIVFPPFGSGGAPQAGVTVNFTCPAPPSGSGPGSTPASATYPVATCAGGTVIGNVGVDDDQAAQLINLGDLGTGLHEWWAGTLDGLNPQTQSLLPPTVQHCDADAALHAEQYLQSIAPGFTAATLGVDVLNCNPGDVVVAINSCLERGDDSTYGFQAQCCPPPPPPNDPTTGTNCYSYCVSGPNFPVQISMASLTQDYAPGNPTYADPATICQDLIGDTTAWMDQNVPGGPSPVGGPLLCGVNWGVNMGGWYVPGTLATTCNVTVWNDWAQCMGDARVEICMEFQCLMEPGEPLKPERDG